MLESRPAMTLQTSIAQRVRDLARPARVDPPRSFGGDATDGPRSAPVWNTIWSQRGRVASAIDRVRQLLHRLHRRVLEPHCGPTTELLELGCGPASLTLSLAPKIRRLVGLDISDEALRQARAAQRQLGVTNAEFLLGDCRAVPFSAAFDVVWSAGLIEHFFDRDINVVQEHLKSAKPGGIVLLSVPAKYSLHWLHYRLTRPKSLRWLWPWSEVPAFQAFYTPRRLRELGQRTGFPARVCYLPPTFLGWLLGILLLEIRKLQPETYSGPSSRTS